ncbi:MAG: NAD(P)H-dependent oxidoreductase [Bacteroidetes bacterium]|nr:NAD(P)H-dependent oxidoreductase [Bacteroidota bacterium]
MKKILHIISSPKGEASRSIKLAGILIDKLLATYPGSTVKTIDLVKKEPEHLKMEQIAAFFTPAAQHSEQQKEALLFSDESIREVLDADIIVIGAPTYNFSIHSSLKAWIDHIVRAGLTFSYSEKGVAGLVQGKKVYLVLSSGLMVTEGPAKAPDFVEPYLRHMLAFLGMTDVSVVRLEGADVPGVKEQAWDKAVSSIGF